MLQATINHQLLINVCILNMYLFRNSNNPILIIGIMPENVTDRSWCHKCHKTAQDCDGEEEAVQAKRTMGNSWFQVCPCKKYPTKPRHFFSWFWLTHAKQAARMFFFYIPWYPGSLGPPGHVFRKKLLCRQWKLQIHSDLVWLCMAADFLLIHEKSAAESGFLGCAAKPLAF